MQRAYNGIAGNHAVTQGTAAMRAPIVDRRETIAQVEDGYVAASDLDVSAFADGKILCGCDLDPAHCNVTASIG
jgi:hypothetical protein